MELTPAQIMDMEKIEHDFSDEIKQHALDDALGHAPKGISAKLRSARHVIRWGQMLALLVAERASKQERVLLNAKRVEQAQQKKLLFPHKQITDGGLLERMKKQLDVDCGEAMSLHEIDVWLNALVVAELRNIKEEIQYFMRNR